MKSLTQAEKRVLNPACPPGARGLFTLAAGLVITLTARGITVADVTLLLGVTAMSVIAMTNPAATTRVTGLIITALAQPAGAVLTRIATAAVPRGAAPAAVTS